MESKRRSICCTGSRAASLNAMRLLAALVLIASRRRGRRPSRAFARRRRALLRRRDPPPTPPARCASRSWRPPRADSPPTSSATRTPPTRGRPASSRPTPSSRRASSTTRRSGFDALVKSYPLLVDYHRLCAARAHLAGRKGNGGARAGQTKFHRRRRSTATRVSCAARRERALGRAGEAAAEYRGYLEAYPSSWRAAEARSAWPRRSTPPADHDERARRVGALYLEAPTRAGASRPRRTSAPRPTSPPTSWRTRAMALFDAMRNAESESGVEDGARRARPRPTRRLPARYHVAQSVFKAARALALGAAVRRRGRRLRQGQGRGPHRQGALPGRRARWGQKGDNDRPRRARRRRCSRRSGASIRRTATPTTRGCARPSSTTSSRTRPRSTELLVGLPEAFPSGDQQRRGAVAARLPRLAQGRRRQRQAAGSSRSWTLLPREEGWWEAGRTLYWLGRVADKQGDGDGGGGAATRARCASIRCRTTRCSRSTGCARSRPGSAPTRSSTSSSATPASDDARGSFAPRTLFGEPGFRRGVELARLGLGAEAKRELALAGIEVPRRRARSRPTPSARSCCGWRRCSTIAPANTRCRTSSRATS